MITFAVVDFYRSLGFEADPEGIKVSYAVEFCEAFSLLLQFTP